MERPGWKERERRFQSININHRANSSCFLLSVLDANSKSTRYGVTVHDFRPHVRASSRYRPFHQSSRLSTLLSFNQGKRTVR